MKKLLILIPIALTSILMTSCGFEEIQQQAGQKFGDQHFKTAIALIELHHTRHSEYPGTLEDLEYLGDWDVMIFSSLKYQKLEDGYELNVLKNELIRNPESLNYPESFWQGLGLKKSNVKNNN